MSTNQASDSPVSTADVLKSLPWAIPNYLLQLLGDPRLWPHNLPLPPKWLLWRTVEQGERLPLSAAPKDRVVRLQALATAQFNEAKAWFLLVTMLYLVGGIITGLAFLITPARLWLTVVAVLLQVGAAFARIRAVRLSSIAHDAEWRALVMDGLSPTDVELDRAALIENVMSDSARRRAKMMPDHYSSTANPGGERLIVNLRQTAFMMSALSGGAKVQAFFVGLVFVAIPLAAPVYWMASGNAWPPEAGVLLVTTVLPLWDAIGRQRSWRDAESTLERVVESLSGKTDQRDALPYMIDVMTVMAMAPPIPRTVNVRWLRDGLRDRWKTMFTEPRDTPPAPDTAEPNIPPIHDTPPPQDGVVPYDADGAGHAH